MAGLSPQVGFTRLAAVYNAEVGLPDFRCHPRLVPRKAVKTWMPGIKPGMTNERQCVSPPSWPGIAVRRTACFRAPMSPQVGFTRLAAVYNAEVGLARLPMPSTSCSSQSRKDVDARHKVGHDE